MPGMNATSLQSLLTGVWSSGSLAARLRHEIEDGGRKELAATRTSEAPTRMSNGPKTPKPHFCALL